MLQTARKGLKESSKDQEVQFCPIRRSTCIRGLCAWWIKEELSCAVKVLAMKPRREEQGEE